MNEIYNMSFFQRNRNNEINCQNLIKFDGKNIQLYGIDVGGLQLGQFKYGTEVLQTAGHALMLLDAHQYQLCTLINSIEDKKIKDNYLIKIIDEKIKAQGIIQVIASLSLNPQSKDLQETLKNLILSNRQKVIDLEKDIGNSTIKQQKLLNSNNINGESIDIGNSSFEEKMKEMDSIVLSSDNVIIDSKSLQFYQSLLDNLKRSHETFLNQIIFRDQLMELLENDKRKEIQDILNKNYEYEKAFLELYDYLNKEEKKKFAFIREITETIKEYNQEIYNLLKDKDNKEFWKEIPRLKDLYMHVELWLSKYRALKDEKDVCLIYEVLKIKDPFLLELKTK